MKTKQVALALVGIAMASAALADQAKHWTQIPIVPRSTPPLALKITGVPPLIHCDAAPGTQIAAVNVTGGNGNPVSIVWSGTTQDAVLTGSAPPTALVIGPNGINSPTLTCSALPASCTVTNTATCPLLTGQFVANQP